MQILTVHLPNYTASCKPDAEVIGKILDDQIRESFMGKAVVVRGVASSEHMDKTIDELIDIITKTGTDRYDPYRSGDRYENVENKQIDLFGVTAVVSARRAITQMIIWGFYHSSLEIHGRAVRIDIVIIYDAAQLEQVVHRYEGRNDIKDDGFTFKYPERKAEAVLGILKIT